MKKVMNRNKAIIIAVMAFISTSFSTPLLAMDKKADPPVVEIKYLGFNDKNPVFEITISNVQVDNYYITVRGESGTALYSEKISGKNFSRNYLTETKKIIPEVGLVFEIRPAAPNKTKVKVLVLM